MLARRILTAVTILFVLWTSAPLAAQNEPEPPGAESESAAEEPAQELDAGEQASEGVEAEQSTQTESREPPTANEVPHRELLIAEHDARSKANRIGMTVLGGWALLNIGWGTVGLLTNSEDPPRAFHLTNAAWNIVNGLIATVGYFSNAPRELEAPSLVDTLEKSHNSEKLYLVNAALDLAYMLGGGYLIARGLDERKDALVGTGRSLILQGGFLFVFDAAMFTVHYMRRSKLSKALRGAP